MLNKLRYLLAEGFEVASVSAYDPPEEDKPGTAALTWVETNLNGQRRLRSQQFEITYDEAQEVASLFLHR